LIVKTYEIDYQDFVKWVNSHEVIEGTYLDAYLKSRGLNAFKGVSDK